jgi:hypothetical protein
MDRTQGPVLGSQNLGENQTEPNFDIPNTGSLVGWVKKKTSSILIVNLIPLENLSSPSKGTFS